MRIAAAVVVAVEEDAVAPIKKMEMCKKHLNHMSLMKIHPHQPLLRSADAVAALAQKASHQVRLLKKMA
jgi:hypothetical protein